MRILIVGAHPDDETLGAGGTIARLAQEGHEVSVAVIHQRHLHKELKQVCDLLGVKNIHPELLGLKDQRFDAVDMVDIVNWIQYCIGSDTDVVYTHHHGDLNLDHQIISKAVLTATRPKPGCSVKDVYMFEVPSSTDWSFGYTFQPNVFMSVGATMNKKLDAMEIYQGEVHPYPHPRSTMALRAIAQRWGSMVGLYYAEAFQLVRSIR